MLTNLTQSVSHLIQFCLCAKRMVQKIFNKIIHIQLPQLPVENTVGCIVPDLLVDFCYVDI